MIPFWMQVAVQHGAATLDQVKQLLAEMESPGIPPEWEPWPLRAAFDRLCLFKMRMDNGTLEAPTTT